MDVGNTVGSNASPAEEPLQVALGDAYLLGPEIGRGGMARVYRAHDRKHDRAVAVKVLHPDIAQTLGAERFRREIRLAARLQHPHILPVFDSGSADGWLWYTMPLVTGETLQQRLARERQLPIGDAIRLASEVARALHHAHGEGVVHRDVKPANILLTADGQTLLADFGIARAFGTAEAPPGEGRVTGTGLSLGTPAYMSPEQGAGEPDVDGRSDQYALACVLYECLAGEPPFTGPTPQAVLAKRFVGPAPDVGVLRDGVTPHVRAAIARALGRSPADRFLTLRAFAAALDGEGLPSPARSFSRGRTMLAGVGVAMAVIALGGGATVLHRRAGGSSSATAPTRVIATAGGTQLTFTGGAEDPSLSPDGRQIAYVQSRCPDDAGRECATELRVRDIASGESVALATANMVIHPQWSADGTWLLSTMVLASGERGSYLTPRLGGTTRRIASGTRAAFSASGDTVLWISRSTNGDVASLQRVRAATGELLDSTVFRSVIGLLGGLTVSPDGRRLALVAPGRVLLATMDGSVTDSSTAGVDFARWSPSGDALYGFVSGPGIQELLVRLDVDAARGRFRETADTVLRAGTLATGTFDLGRDGTLVHTGGTVTRTLWAFELDATETRPRRLAESTSWLGYPVLSSDGQVLAYSATDRLGDNVYVMPFLGGASQAVTHDPDQLFPTGWFPDTRRLAYAGRADTLYALQVPGGTRQVMGRTNALPLGDGRVVEIDEAGRRLIFRSATQSVHDTVALPESIDAAVAVAADADGSGVYLMNAGAPGHLSVRRVDRRSGAMVPRLSVSIDVTPRVLGVQDRALFYTTWPRRLDKGHPTIWRSDREGTATKVAELPMRCDVGSLSMSSNGRRFVCSEAVRRPDLFLVERFDGARGRLPNDR